MWAFLLRCFLDTKSPHNLFKYFSRFEFADHSVGLVLFYSSHFWKTRMIVSEVSAFLSLLRSLTAHSNMKSDSELLELLEG